MFLYFHHLPVNLVYTGTHMPGNWCWLQVGKDSLSLLLSLLSHTHISRDGSISVLLSFSGRKDGQPYLKSEFPNFSPLMHPLTHVGTIRLSPPDTVGLGPGELTPVGEESDLGLRLSALLFSESRVKLRSFAVSDLTMGDICVTTFGNTIYYTE